MVLHGGEPGPAVSVRDHLHVVQLVGVHGARPQGPHPPGAHESIEGLQGLLDRGGVVETVDDVQVEVVGAQTLQGAVDLPFNGRARQVPLVEVDLARQHHVLTFDAEVLQRGSDELLARAVGVDVRGVDEVDAQLQSASNHRLGGLLIDDPLVKVREDLPETHAPDAQPRDGDVRHAESGVFHVQSPSMRESGASKAPRSSLPRAGPRGQVLAELSRPRPRRPGCGTPGHRAFRRPELMDAGRPAERRGRHRHGGMRCRPR